jgi:hypothetical protein
MLRDIAIINDMLGEILAYLRDGCRTEPAQLVDLSSLLQTICAQFTDVGHPARLPRLFCRLPSGGSRGPPTDCSLRGQRGRSI